MSHSGNPAGLPWAIENFGLWLIGVCVDFVPFASDVFEIDSRAGITIALCLLPTRRKEVMRWFAWLAQMCLIPQRSRLLMSAIGPSDAAS